MLNGLMKKLGISPDVDEEVNMSVEEKAPTVELANHESVVAELAALKTDFEAAQATVESFKAQLEAAQAALAAVEADKAEMAAKAQEKLQADRFSKLQAIVGDEKAEAVMAKLANADDVTFDTVMDAMAASYAAEADSTLFVEAGLDAQPAPVAEKDAVQRLADNIAAQFKTVK